LERYNADPSHRVKLQFYGLDMPLHATGGTASPSQVLPFVLDYLASIDDASAQEHRSRIEGRRWTRSVGT
jgi:erythromycin esterase